MKFRDPKTGEVFENIKDALENYCPAKDVRDVDACKRCAIGSSKNTDDTICTDFSVDHPAEAARLMGYEVIEDENEHWMIADDGDGLVCPGCGEDFCTIIHETDRFKYCPNCGKALLPPMENSDDESDTPTDAVNHPAHYTQGGIECIDAIKAAVEGLTGIRAFCAGNAIKYIWRYDKKNGVQDLDKAIWYINRLKEELKNE